MGSNKREMIVEFFRDVTEASYVLVDAVTVAEARRLALDMVKADPGCLRPWEPSAEDPPYIGDDVLDAYSDEVLHD